MSEILGVDFSRTIAEGWSFRGVARTVLNYSLQVRPIEGAFDALTILGSRFKERHVISLCAPRHEEYVLQWLKHNDFYVRTGIVRENIHFCWDKERQGKASICKELGITHFLDDRVQILDSLAGIVPNRYLFQPREKELAKHPDLLTPDIIRIESWAQFVEVVR